jgi:hypothetical protein
VVLLLHDIHKAGAADIHAPDYPFNRQMADLRRGAGTGAAACGAAAA